MRLLLDEHHSPEIARLLRTRGHDVVAVAERTIGRLVDALNGFLRRHEGEENYRNQVQWLSVQSPHRGR